MKLLLSITNPSISNARPYVCSCEIDQVNEVIKEFPKSVIIIQELPAFERHPELDDNESGVNKLSPELVK